MKNSIKNTFILSVLICAFLVQQPAYAGLFDFLKEPPRRERRDDRRDRRYDRRDDHRDHRHDDRDRRYDRRDDHRDRRRDDRDHKYDRRDDRRDDRDNRHSSAKGWRSVGSASAGSAKEFSFNGAKECYIEIISGSVSINTVVIRRGGQKQSIPVVTKFSQGQRFNIPIDTAATGLRVSAGGKGTYRVCVK